MWERRSYFDGVSLRCTVKFVGPIPPWPNTTALGVEWDEPSRGRNSGDLNGIQYFDCQVPGAGSFIKASRIPEKEVSLSTAIFDKYVANSQFKEIELSGGKSIETVGVDKVHKKHENVENLSIISLEASRVKSMFDGPVKIGNLQALTSLDLSNNLIESFDCVLDLVSILPNLSCLRLNGNRLIFNSVKVLSQVREVHMSNLLVNENDIPIISACFPEVRTLSLAKNRLTSVPRALPPHLTTLDLSFNFITQIVNLPTSLKSLFISDNNVKEVTRALDRLEMLDICGYQLSWESISILGASDITDLHITLDEFQETVHRPFVIARCPLIQKLNGTIVSSKERNEAEMYTINAVMKKKHPMLPDAVWQDLLDKYGKPAPLPNCSIRARLISYYIGSNPNPFRIVKDAPTPRLLRQIAREVNMPLRNISLASLRGSRLVDQSEIRHVLTVEDVIEDGSRLDII